MLIVPGALAQRILLSGYYVNYNGEWVQVMKTSDCEETIFLIENNKVRRNKVLKFYLETDAFRLMIVGLNDKKLVSVRHIVKYFNRKHAVTFTAIQPSLCLFRSWK